jgi:adenosylcobinamide-GDP ribazoletransferase
MIPSLILAVRFLTIAPVPGREATGPEALGRAAAWFPLVGLMLGAALALADRWLSIAFPPLLSSAIVLSLWKIATGGMHLDGLADCLDGLGGRDRAARLAIMQDSRIGAFGAIGLILCLSVGLHALADIPAGIRGRILLLAPVVGRIAPILIGPWFRAATPLRGAGGLFLGALSTWTGTVYAAVTAGAITWLLGTWGIAAIALALTTVWLWSAFLARRLGGLTGDALGAAVELSELSVLVAGAGLAHRGLI